MKNEALFDRVVASIAETTRYPSQLLTPDADLEDDLGIDSVKRMEIVVALADTFNLDADEFDPEIRTIDQVAAWIDNKLNAGSDGLTNRAHTDQEHPPADSDSRSFEKNSPGPAPYRLAELDERERSAQTPAELLANRGNGHALRRPDFREAKSASIRPEATPPRSASAAVPGREQPAVKTQSNLPLSGRVALVTGSGRGVGRVIARKLSALGASVVVNSFHSRDEGEATANEINNSGGRAVHLWGSVANAEHVDAMFDTIEQQFGHLDILICNASDGRLGSFSDLTSEDWDRAFRTNVAGHYRCAMRAAQLMAPRGGGSIVTLSTLGARQYVDGLGCQGVVKAAVESLTRYLACELAKYGVRANCIAPGPIYSDVISKFPDAGDAHAYWESITPAGELCNPIDLANTISFLISDEARGINGAIWTVDRGMSANVAGPVVQESNSELVPALTL